MSSKRQLKWKIDFSKGLTLYSGLLVPEGGTPDCDQVELHKGVLRRAIGMSGLTATTIAAELPLLLDEFYKSSGTNFLMQITDTSCRRFTSPSTWTSLGAHGTPLTKTNNPDLFVSGAVAEDLHIITDSINNVRKWNGTGNYGNLLGLLQDDDGENPFATFLAEFAVYFYSALLFGATTEDGTDYPFRIRWSAIGDVEDYNHLTSGFQDLVDTPDRCRNAMAINDKLFVYKTESIWQGIFVGYPRQYYFAPIIQQTGLLARKSLVQHMNTHFALMNEGIFKFDGRQLQDITGDLRPLLFGSSSSMNMDAAPLSVGIYVEELSEYWLVVPLVGETYPQNIFRYSLKNNAWWRKDVGRNIYCAGTWEEDIITTWANIADVSWDEISEIWNAKSLGVGSALTLFGVDDSAAAKVIQVDSIVASDDGVINTAYYETQDYSFAAGARYRKLWWEMEGAGTCELFYSFDEGSSYTSLGTKPVPTDFKWVKWSFDFTTEIVRFRLQLSDADCYARKMRMLYFEREQ